MRLFALAAVAVFLLAADDPARVGSTAPSVAARRLDEMATRLRLANIGAARLAIFDVAWPADRGEFEDLGRSGVIEVTAVTADEKELPVKRVYVRYEGGEIDLKRIAARRFAVPESAAVHAVGAFREDSYYLLPMGLADQRGMLLLDFSAHREEFDLAGLPLNPPSFSATAAAPSVDQVKLAVFVKREFQEAPALGAER